MCARDKRLENKKNGTYLLRNRKRTRRHSADARRYSRYDSLIPLRSFTRTQLVFKELNAYWFAADVLRDRGFGAFVLLAASDRKSDHTRAFDLREIETSIRYWTSRKTAVLRRNTDRSRRGRRTETAPAAFGRFYYARGALQTCTVAVDVLARKTPTDGRRDAQNVSGISSTLFSSVSLFRRPPRRLDPDRPPVRP